MAIVYKPRNIYSEDAYGDSFSPSYLHQVSSSYLTYGSFSSYDNLDYYYINATAGNYKLTVTTEGLSNVYNNNFTVSIIDSFGNTILTEDAFRSDVYTDNVTFYYGGSGAFYVKIVNNYYQAFSYALTLASTYVAPADITSPIVYSIAYGSNDGSLALGEAVTLAVTLNEAVYVTGTPTLALANGGVATYTGGSGTSMLTFSYTAAAGQTAADLATAASNALAGTIRDLAGNAVTAAGFNGVNPTGTLAVDVTAPSASTFTPTDGATAVAVGANIVLTFSENIAKGTGAITLRSGSATGTIVESFDAATSSRISISGSTLTIDPTNNLAGNTRYFVVFSSGNVRDLAGNAYRGTSTYDFTTGSAPTTTSDDYTNTTATTGRVFTGSAATTGTIEVAGDVDAFRVYLTAGATYTFNLDATSGSLDPYLSLYDPNLTQIAYNNDYGSSRNSQITFTATSSGAYYVAAKDLETGTGAYSLRATTTAADDYANNTATTGVVTIGGAATTGRINYADDADLFRVSLTAGVTYTFNLNATSGSYNPYLSLFDSNLTKLAYNDDFGSSLNSQITFTATSSGTYYLQAFSLGTDTGTFSLQGGAQATDTIAPTVRSFSPTDAATGVSVGNNIVLTFSEAIARGTGTITIRSGSASGTIVESFDAATSNRISISGSTLTIDPTNNLAGNTRYFVVFSSGNVRDLAGNAYKGTSTYDFTTGSAPTTTSDDYPDSTGTTGVVTIGAAATTGAIETTGDLDLFRVSLTAGVTYTFNLNATSGSLNPYLSLYDPNLTRLAYNDDFGSSNNSQITFTATSSGTYYLQARSFGTNTGTYSLQGTAADTTAPTVSAFTPADGATAVAVGANIVLTFSENIAKGTGTITLRSGSATGAIVESFDAASSNRLTVSGSTLTIDPTNNLSANTQYFVVFTSGNIKDTAGNAYAGISTYDFRTAAADATAPTVTSFSPTDAATGVAVGNNIVLTFSEAIARGTGTISIRSGSASGTIVESFDAATSNRISISGSTLTIDPTNNLAGNTRYFVVFSSGNVRDLAGNAYRGTSTYDFTTGSAPTTTSDDYTNTAATTGRVFAGSGSATGTIEVAGDVDAFRVYLTAGATYTFNLDATSGSLDPYFSLYDPNLTQVAFNNDYGSSRNSQITFTATSSGAYYLAAQGFAGTGAYSLRATTTAADDYSFNTTTTGVVTIGGAATTGRIDYADDADLFRVSLTAGVTYTFNLNATSGSYNPYLSLLDSNGTQLAYNDDFGSSLNSQITFTAASSGTYYLVAFSFGTDTATYSLQGRIGSTSAIAQSALSVAPADSLGRPDGMAPETDLAMIPPSKSNEPGNQIGVIEAEILLALANSNDPFANEHLALQNFSVNQGAHPQSIILEHSPHTTHYSVADTFHFGSEDVLEHFRNDDVALTRTQFNAVIFDPAHHWTANSAFDPAIYNGDEVIFDVTEFGSLSTANGYHQVDFIL